MEAKPKQMRQWSGVNERTVPELLDVNVFHVSQGVTWRDYNGAGRIKGKKLFASLQSPVLHISASATQLFVQTTTAIISFPIDELLIDATWVDELENVLTTEDTEILEVDL